MNSPNHNLNGSQEHRKWPRDTLAMLSSFITDGEMCEQDYVASAVLALMDGFDTPSLVILAGLDLSPSNPGERNEYFRKSIQELGIDILDSEDNILVRFSGLLCKGLLWGEIDPKDALSMLASYNVWSSYSEPLFGVWASVDDEIDLLNAGIGPLDDNYVNETIQNEYIKKVAEQYIALLETRLP